ncbi:MFS transporter [Streptomyces radicis]|uniref:MFS transporter n=1 Tax=Streptomyces radicis TaxID=1750517 RepID=A0A3A9WI93_9ACTN|nr:MFS transporter [Streptomyces radicis]RKN07426.1 MFS transporter [Streptomyces radicis]RKN19555.1 MFS transporter [Streptomyces radicis]
MSHERATRKEWIGLAVLVLPVLLLSMDMTVLYFAVPFLSASLEPTATQQLWIVDIYAFMLAGLLITMGTIGDHIGRRLLLMLGAGAFGVASLAAAYAGSSEFLIASRALLGVAGAVLAPSTLSLIRTMFRDPGERRTAIAVWTIGMSGGSALGPIVSGLLLEHFWWGSVFLINIPVIALLLLIGPFLLPEYRSPEPGRFDLIGALLSLGAILPVIYGIKELAEDGFAWSYAAVTAVGVVVGVLFFLRQRTAATPLIDLSLFRSRGFSASIGVNLVTLFAMVGFLLFSTQWIQLVHGLSPLEAALWTLPAPVAVAIAASLAAALAKTVRPGHIIAGGMVIATVGFGIMTQLRVDSSLAVVVIGASVLSAGVGIAAPLTADLIVSSAPPERAGSISALPETSNQLGGAFGVAILGSIGAAVYTRDVADATSALPPEAAEPAEGSLGGAAEVAEHLPEEAGEPLLAAAAEAFTHGMNIAAAAAGGVVLVSAVAAAVLMRHVTSPAAAPAKADRPEAEQVSAHGPE